MHNKYYSKYLFRKIQSTDIQHSVTKNVEELFTCFDFEFQHFTNEKSTKESITITLNNQLCRVTNSPHVMQSDDIIGYLLQLQDPQELFCLAFCVQLSIQLPYLAAVRVQNSQRHVQFINKLRYFKYKTRSSVLKYIVASTVDQMKTVHFT